MSTLNAVLADGKTVAYHAEPIADVGNARIHVTADKAAVIRFFKNPADPWAQRELNRFKRLMEIFDARVNHTPAANLVNLPSAIVEKPLPGLVFPVYPAEFLFDSGRFQGKEKVAIWFLKPKLRSMLTEADRGNFANTIQLCIQLARVVHELHTAGHAMTCLNPTNLLVDPKTQRLLFIGAGELLVQGEPTEVLPHPGYGAPENVIAQSQQQAVQPSVQADRHSLAVLIYQFLLKRHPLDGPKVHSENFEEDAALSHGEKALFIEHPSDKSNHWLTSEGYPLLKVSTHDLGPYLAPLIRKAFVDGLHNPRQRPTAQEWETALVRTVDLLAKCSADCEDEFFVLGPYSNGVCSWCDSPPERPIPVLRLSGGDRGAAQLLTGWSGRQLYRRQVTTRVESGDANDASLAHFQWHNDQWVLVNDRLDHLTSPAGSEVPPGSAIALQENTRFWLCRETRRRASVDWKGLEVYGLTRRCPAYWVYENTAPPEAIEKINAAFNELVLTCQCDPQALETLWISAAAFGESPEVVTPLTPVHEISIPNSLPGAKSSSRSESHSLREALELLNQQMELELETTTALWRGDFKPIVFLFLSQTPDDSWLKAAEQLKNRALNIAVLSVGSECDLSAMQELSDVRMPLGNLNGKGLYAFFLDWWVSQPVDSFSPDS